MTVYIYGEMFVVGIEMTETGTLGDKILNLCLC